MARSGKEAFNDQDSLDLLFPEWKVWLDQVILDKQTQVNTEIMGQLMSGVEEAMGPFEELAKKFRNYDSGAEKAPEEVPLFKKKSKSEDAKMESPALSKAPSTTSAAKEEEKKEEIKEPETVTTLKSLNMEDVTKKT